MHNVYFVQYDAPVSVTTLYPKQLEERVDTGAYLRRRGGYRGNILGEITDLEFENH